MIKKKILIVLGIIVILFVVKNLLGGAPSNNTTLVDRTYKPIASKSTQFKYLAFQITSILKNSPLAQKAFAASQEKIETQVKNIVDKIGVTGSENRMVAFIVGPLSFDSSDVDIKELISSSFALAKKYNVAVGFHIDDSMFWSNNIILNKPENIEWLDWNKTPNTGRRLDWSAKPMKIAPHLCFNSSGVIQEVKKRATLIAQEISKQVADLEKEGKGYLFAGVLAGWETQIGRDFDTGTYLGYCALANKGYSSLSKIDIDYERETIVQEFISVWTKALYDGGIQKEKLFSHIAFQPIGLYHLSEENTKKDGTTRSYSEYSNFSTVRTAFSAYHNPGFSTYPAAGFTDAIYDELMKNGNPSWASSEGAAIDPSLAEKGDGGIDAETYLASLYNHGAVLINIFGWGVGPKDFPFRIVAESNSAINAYRKFIAGEELIEKEGVIQKGVSANFKANIEKLQKTLPAYMEKNPNQKETIMPIVIKFEKALEAGKLNEGEQYLNQILEIIQ